MHTIEINGKSKLEQILLTPASQYNGIIKKVVVVEYKKLERTLMCNNGAVFQ